MAEVLNRLGYRLRNILLVSIDSGTFPLSIVQLYGSSKNTRDGF